MPTLCNGIDLATLSAAAGSAAAYPERVGVTCEWQGSSETSVRIEHPAAAPGLFPGERPRLQIQTNLPPCLSVVEEATPVDLLLAAIASSLVTSYIYTATLAGIRIDSLVLAVEAEFDARGFLAPSPLEGSISNVRIAWDTKGSATRHQLLSLAETAARSSPVLKLLKEPVQVLPAS